MEFLSTQRLKPGNSRSLIFSVLMFGPGLKQKIGHECKGKFHFYICMGALLISLSCFCKGQYSGKYSLGFSEESYQGEYNFLSCCGSLSMMNTMKTIQYTKRPFQQSIAEFFSFDNLPNIVHTFSNQFYLPQKVNDATRRTNRIVICPRRSMKQRVEQLYTVSVYIRNIQCTNNYC